MSNRVLLGNLGNSEFGLKISKPGENILTTADKNLIFDSTKNRNGQVLGGGVDIDFVFSPSASTEASESQGLNYLSVTGIKKAQLGFIPLVIHVEKNIGEFEDFAAGDRDIYVSDIAMMESTATLICPVPEKNPKPIKPKPKLKSFVGTLTVAVLPEVTVVLVVSVPCVVVAFAN